MVPLAESKSRSRQQAQHVAVPSVLLMARGNKPHILHQRVMRTNTPLETKGCLTLASERSLLIHTGNRCAARLASPSRCRSCMYILLFMILPVGVLQTQTTVRCNHKHINKDTLRFPVSTHLSSSFLYSNVQNKILSNASLLYIMIGKWEMGAVIY